MPNQASSLSLVLTLSTPLLATALLAPSLALAQEVAQATILAQAPSTSVAPTELPPVTVTASRLGDGITGASTTVIPYDEIQRSPGDTLQDVLERQAGLQVQRQFGGVRGARDTVDMRGFGATASANTLVLVNGRRLNDLDLAGIDFTAIPKASIERIEVIRGNSGSVLYGDGASGGVINIVTRDALPGRDVFTIEGAIGSFQQRETAIHGRQSIGPYAFSAYGNWIDSDGWRANNKLLQKNLQGEARYNGDGYGAYVSLAADDQQLGLPGARRRTLTSNLMASDPEGATTPNDFANKQGLNLTLGGTRQFGDTAELIIDGGVRRKTQQSSQISPFGTAFDTYVDTELTTFSFTPRLTAQPEIWGHKLALIGGLDIYSADYNSDRKNHDFDRPIHRYNAEQQTYAAYGQATFALTRDTDLAAGMRVQRAKVSASDAMDAGAPGYGGEAAANPFDGSDTNYSYHLGIEHRLSKEVVPFARIGRSFRYPTLDERIVTTAFGVPGQFNLKTQTSHDIEAGLHGDIGTANYRVSAYWMELNDEIYFDGNSFTNINLDPTRRRGVELQGGWRVLPDLKLRGSLSYIHAEFREGRFAGNRVPLVSPWTGSAGLSWEIIPKWLRFDIDGRLVDARRMDNDRANFQPQIPAYALVDVTLGGTLYDRARWAISVQNLLDREYYDYSIASATTFGTYNAYPQPGRTAMARVSLDF
ncbi:MAG: TonB-dependent receptor [Ferrovibrio sp.]|nr:TonB-dependent receptor [Ferrovibrio sp.]